MTGEIKDRIIDLKQMLHDKKVLLPIFALLGLTVVLGVVVLTRQSAKLFPTPAGIKPTSVPLPSLSPRRASLSFSPRTLETTVSVNFNLSVNLDPGAQNVSSADLFLEYDPAYLSLQSAKSGGYFAKEANKVIGGGKVHVLLSKVGNSKESVLNLVFRAVKAGRPQVRFGLETTVYDENGRDVLGEMGAAVIDAR